MPNTYEPWDLYELDALGHGPLPMTEEGHKQAVARLARDIANYLVGNMRAIGASLSDTAIQTYYEAYLLSFSSEGRSDENSKVLLKCDAVTLDSLAPLETNDPYRFIEFLATHVITMEEPLQPYHEHFNELQDTLRRHRSSLEELRAKQCEDEQEDKARSIAVDALQEKIVSCQYWSLQLFSVNSAAASLQKTMILSQILKVALIIRAQAENAITDLAVARHFITILKQCWVFGIHDHESGTVSRILNEFNKIVHPLLKSTYDDIGIFCLYHCTPPREYLQPESNAQAFVKAISKINNQFTTIFLSMHREQIPLSRSLELKPLLSLIPKALKVIHQQLVSKEEQKKYTLLVDTLLHFYKLFSEAQPLSAFNLNALASKITPLCELKLAEHEDTSPLIGIMISQMDNLYELFKSAPSESSRASRIAIPPLEALMRVIEALKRVAESNPKLITPTLNELERVVIEKIETIKSALPLKKITPTPPPHQNTAKLQSLIDREVNLARRALKKKSTFFIPPQRPSHHDSQHEDAAETSTTSKTANRIQALFLSAQRHSVSRLDKSIEYMETAYQLATDTRKESAFICLMHYRLRWVMNRYRQFLADPIDLLITKKPIFFPKNPSDLTVDEKRVLKDQKNRAFKIASTYSYFSEISQYLAETVERIKLEENAIHIPRKRATIQGLLQELNEIQNTMTQDYGICQKFLAETGEVYRLTNPPIKKKPASTTASVFAEFRQVASRLYKPDEHSQSPATQSANTQALLQKMLQEENLAIEENISWISSDEGGLELKVKHREIAIFTPLLNQAPHNLYIKGGAVMRCLTSYTLLPCIGLDFITSNTALATLDSLQEYASWRVESELPNLVQVQSEPDGPIQDVFCGQTQDLEALALACDFTRSAVFLKPEPLVEQDPQTMCFKVLDPTGRGIKDIQENRLRCVQGTLKTTVTTPARGRRLLKALMQNACPDLDEDIAFLESGRVIQVLLQDDPKTTDELDITNLPSVRQLKQLYYGLLREAGDALRMLSKPQYRNAALDELAWLLGEELTESSLDELASLASVESGPHEINSHINKRLLMVLESHGILPSSAITGELIASKNLPQALVGIMRTLQPSQDAYINDLIARCNDYLRPSSRGPRLFAAGSSQPTTLLDDLRQFMSSQGIKEPDGEEVSDLLTALEEYKHRLSSGHQSVSL